MPKLDLTRAIAIKGASGDIASLKGPGFSWVKPSGGFVFSAAIDGALDDLAALVVAAGAGVFPIMDGYCFQDAAGTVAAGTGDPVRRINAWTGSSYLIAPSDTARPTRTANYGGTELEGGSNSELSLNGLLDISGGFSFASLFTKNGVDNNDPWSLGNGDFMRNRDGGGRGFTVNATGPAARITDGILPTVPHVLMIANTAPGGNYTGTREGGSTDTSTVGSSTTTPTGVYLFNNASESGRHWTGCFAGAIFISADEITQYSTVRSALRTCAGL